MAYGLLITVGLIAAYAVLVFWLARTGRMERYNLSLMLGFVLMIRTGRGRRLLDILARPKRMWNALADLGTAVTLLVMAAMTLFFFWTLTIVLRPGSGVRPLEASEILVIPGVNPFVPLWYGLIALIVALVVHEGGHGVLARANDLRVKSMGLLVAVVPIGAFVEPDDVELLATTRRKRLRVFGAGPMTNLVAAGITLALFVAMVAAAAPVAGAPIAAVVEDAPAHAAGLPPASIITHIDGERTRDWETLSVSLDSRRVGDTVTLRTEAGGSYEARLDSTWDHVGGAMQERILEENATLAAELQGDPFLGVRPYRYEVEGGPLADPFGGVRNFLVLLALPLGEVQDQPYLSVYLPEFYEAPWGGDLYIIAATLLFWIFWINLMLGLTNVLPMLPLDGGHIFRDYVGGFLDRVRPGMERARKERLIGITAAVVSVAILITFLLQIVGPRLV